MRYVIGSGRLVILGDRKAISEPENHDGGT